jgi:cyclopropane-fatty-acyl-phospholipid synthase
VDFIQHYIFPGSCIPSTARMMDAVRRETTLRLLDLEDLTGHYATTLARWRDRFLERVGDLDRLGFDLRFRRLWTFYFGYCEGGFREGRIGDVHLLFAGPEYRGGSDLLPMGDRS